MWGRGQCESSEGGDGSRGFVAFVADGVWVCGGSYLKPLHHIVKLCLFRPRNVMEVIQFLYLTPTTRDEI